MNDARVNMSERKRKHEKISSSFLLVFYQQDFFLLKDWGRRDFFFIFSLKYYVHMLIDSRQYNLYMYTLFI